MKKPLKISLAQLNFTVGDLTGNVERIIAAALTARDLQQADLIVFPELAITGYPPEDLLFRDHFMDEVAIALRTIGELVKGIDMVIGYPRRAFGLTYNSAAHISGGKLVSYYDKCALPNYGVFDEKRYFSAGTTAHVISIGETKLGITICEDAWQPECIPQAVALGADIILCINASPFHVNKQKERLTLIQQRAKENALPILYVHQVGGQDELVFDGASFAVDSSGECIHQAVAFEESLSLVEFKEDDLISVIDGDAKFPSDVAAVHDALVLSIRDYVRKNKFKGVLIGLSGGIDSALTVALAVKALGASQVEAVMMPSKFTSVMSFEDSRALAKKLDIHYHEISIDGIYQDFLQALQPAFANKPVDATEENIQARCRGVLLMALSNKQHKLVLTTGNKSEMAVGYATLYGDMAGGFAPLKDVSKTLVNQLCEYINRHEVIIPTRILTRPPSAELAPDQKDEDSLPPYSQLDVILEKYIEQSQSVDQIVAAGFKREVVQDVVRRVNINEYKRRQSAPGVKVTPLAFGRERRYPITSSYDRN